MYNTFDILEKYINEYSNEIVNILIKEYFSKFVNIKDVSFGDTVDCQCFDIDNNEHMWYDMWHDKWNWTKFENGVIKIDN